MFKKYLIIVLILSVSVLLGAGTKVIPLPDVNKPGQLVYTDRDRIYITEDTTIFIYSLEGFTLLTKFGKKGEGPQEFIINQQLGSIFLDVRTDNIIVNSSGKVSWFTKKGDFIKEVKLPTPYLWGVQSFGKNFIGLQFKTGKIIWRTLNLYDEKFNILKEIEKAEHIFQQGKGLKVLETDVTNQVYGDKLFVSWKEDIQIAVYDTDLKNLYTITHNTERIEVTADDKKRIIDFLKTSPQTKPYFQILQPIRFPNYFPAAFGMIIDNDKIYTPTFRKIEEGKKTEFLIFDIKGKFLKKVIFPLKMSTPILPYPYTIHNGKVYQIIENMDTENWEAHITEIK
ncbi:MAG: hypothetical protein GY940_30930 [bacterium]|nr:hypothetical protein [bacterium]